LMQLLCTRSRGVNAPSRGSGLNEQALAVLPDAVGAAGVAGRGIDVAAEGLVELSAAEARQQVFDALFRMGAKRVHGSIPRWKLRERVLANPTSPFYLTLQVGRFMPGYRT